VAFDAAVNSGPSRGAKWLQAALGVAADGVVGPKTLAAAGRADPAWAIRMACDLRLHFLLGLSTWPTFGKGWQRRVDNVQRHALAMASGPPAAAPDLAPLPSWLIHAFDWLRNLFRNP